MFWSVNVFLRFFYVLQRLRRFPLLATAIPHHTFRKLPACQAWKVGSNLRNRADYVIMPVNQSSSFRRFHSANYFPHSSNYQITSSANWTSCSRQQCTIKSLWWGLRPAPCWEKITVLPRLPSRIKENLLLHGEKIRGNKKIPSDCSRVIPKINRQYTKPTTV